MCSYIVCCAKLFFHFKLLSFNQKQKEVDPTTLSSNTTNYYSHITLDFEINEKLCCITQRTSGTSGISQLPIYIRVDIQVILY